MKTPKIIVVMPAYNAGKTIESVFERIPKAAYKRISKFVVVNDGSTDGTKLVVTNRLMKKYRNRILLLNHESNRGYGGAQKTGFSKALQLGADIAVLLHSDGQYAPEILLDMIEPIENERADVVFASRFLGNPLKGNMPLVRFAGNRILTYLANLVSGARLSEWHSGYRAYSGKALRATNFGANSDKFEFDSEIILQCAEKRLKIIEIPMATHYGSEKSYLRPLDYGRRVLNVLFDYMLHKSGLKKNSKYEEIFTELSKPNKKYGWDERKVDYDYAKWMLENKTKGDV